MIRLRATSMRIRPRSCQCQENNRIGRVGSSPKNKRFAVPGGPRTTKFQVIRGSFALVGRQAAPMRTFVHIGRGANVHASGR